MKRECRRGGFKEIGKMWSWTADTPVHRGEEVDRQGEGVMPNSDSGGGGGWQRRQLREVEGSAGAGGGAGGMAENETKVEGMAARRSGGGDGGSGLRRRQRWRLDDGGVAMTAEKNRGRGKEWR